MEIFDKMYKPSHLSRLCTLTRTMSSAVYLPFENFDKKPRSSRKLWVLGGVAAVLLLVLGGGMMSYRAKVPHWSPVTEVRLSDKGIWT